MAEKCGGVFYDADDFHPPANIEKMKRGEPLDDADRAPWLARLAALLAESGDKPVFLACSALKARYREILSAGRGDVHFVHLSGTPEVIRARLRARPGHFMPESLIDSQFAALETPAELFPSTSTSRSTPSSPPSSANSTYRPHDYPRTRHRHHRRQRTL